MVQYRVRIDVENIRLRLAREAGVAVSEPEVFAWLERQGIRQQFPFASLAWVAGEDALDLLCPWEVLERLPLLMLPPETISAALGA